MSPNISSYQIKIFPMFYVMLKNLDEVCVWMIEI